MKPIPALPAFIVSLGLSALPLQAQETTPAPETAEKGFSLMEEGAKILMRSMLAEMQPKLDELQAGLGAALVELEPALRELAGMIDDIRNYEPPEMLPNGDIIIRRRPNIPQMTPKPGDKIDL